MEFSQFAAYGGSPAGWFAGGGSGFCRIAGGYGGGGDGTDAGGSASNGVANTGGGGGSKTLSGTAGAGGSGIVLVRYAE